MTRLIVAAKTSTLRDALLWIEGGSVWLLNPWTEAWESLGERAAPGIGGRVIRDRREVDDIIARHGLPTATRGAA